MLARVLRRRGARNRTVRPVGGVARSGHDAEGPVVQFLVALVAHQVGERDLSAVAVLEVQRFVALAEDPLVAPLPDGVEDRPERTALLGVDEVGPVAGLVVRLALHHARLDQRVEPDRQPVAGDAEALGPVLEPGDAEEGVAQDQQRPPLADHLEGTGDRAVHVLEGGFPHGDGCYPILGCITLRRARGCVSCCDAKPRRRPSAATTSWSRCATGTSPALRRPRCWICPSTRSRRAEWCSASARPVASPTATSSRPACSPVWPSARCGPRCAPPCSRRPTCRCPRCRSTTPTRCPSTAAGCTARASSWTGNWPGRPSPTTPGASCCGPRRPAASCRLGSTTQCASQERTRPRRRSTPVPFTALTHTTPEPTASATSRLRRSRREGLTLSCLVATTVQGRSLACSHSSICTSSFVGPISPSTSTTIMRSGSRSSR